MLETENDVIRPETLSSLLSVSRIRQRRQRPIYHSTLQVAPEFRVGIGLYSMARRTLPPKAVKINKRNNEPVRKMVSKFRADTGMPVLKSEQVSVVEVQGEKAVFTKEELSTSKYTSTTGLTLLAFLDQSKFDQFQWFRCNGYFLYPDEDKWPGSKEFLACLLRRCLALKKCVLVRVVLSRGKTPKLGCLIPTNGDGQKVPQGFYLFMIPFADEIRDLSALATNSEPSAELIELVEQVVKKTTQKQFDPLLIQNPVLQMKWREIETAVFNDEDIQIEGDDFQDFTEPNVDSMKNRIGEASSEIMRIAQLEGGSFSSALSNKPKVDINMEMEAKNRRVEKLTVDVLKEFLITVQVKVQGKRKADLVASVYEYFKK
jgi:ATP-dependent DNA helicase 2 subunit 1